METLLLELLLMMRRGQIPTRDSPDLQTLYGQLGQVGRRASFTKQPSVERPTTPEYAAPKRRTSFTKHHVIGTPTPSSSVTTPKVAGKEVSFSPPER